MPRYPLRVRDVILSVSAADSLPEAFGEWLFAGNAIDFGDSPQPCPVCGERSVRFLFEIGNALTGESLQVCSPCIVRYGIPVYEQGASLSKYRTKRILEGFLRELRLKSCLEALETLAKTKENDILRNALEFFRQKGFLTPKFAYIVFLRLRNSAIEYSPDLFPVSFAKARYKRDLEAMETGRVRLFWEALTPGQRKVALSMGHTPPQKTENRITARKLK